jgi:hypothetical protein
MAALLKQRTNSVWVVRTGWFAINKWHVSVLSRSLQIMHCSSVSSVAQKCSMRSTGRFGSRWWLNLLRAVLYRREIEGELGILRTVFSGIGPLSSYKGPWQSRFSSAVYSFFRSIQFLKPLYTFARPDFFAEFFGITGTSWYFIPYRPFKYPWPKKNESD